MNRSRGKNMKFMFFIQCLTHIAFAGCGTYLIINNHIGTGIALFILIYLTTYNFTQNK